MLGIVLAVFSLLMIIHVFNYMALMVDNKTIDPFLNTMLEQIEASPVRFLSVLVFCFIGYYCYFAAAMGNIKFGLRFFFLSFYPVIPKETFVNSFMANCLV